MYLLLEEIVKNKDLVKINIWDNDFIVYKCGYVFRNYRNCGKWKLMNLNKCNSEGYLQIELRDNNKEKKMLKLHRLVYYAFNQSTFDIFDGGKDNSIDHINRNPRDNRLSNLRNVTHQQNHLNRKCKGYSKYRDKYQTQIMLKGETIHLGRFDTKGEAKVCYLLNKRFYHKI